MNSIDISHCEEIFTVSRLNREARFLLEGSFPLIWIEGELSNLTIPQSGHWYFSLKDANAQVRCAMFRPQNRKLNHTPPEGSQVLVKARVSLYEGRGEFQLLVDHLENAGEGKLQQAFEKLKKRLFEAGLFNPEHKKKLPAFPKTIGVITSPTGAAIRDIISVVKRRFSCANIIIYPTLVQGDLAANQVVEAIQTANQRQECDVIILARGGGSLEDLWPFNEEKVAYAIYKSHLPIVTGIGHEIDFTIADFVADHRAPTPSAAAELVAPHTQTLLETLFKNKSLLFRFIREPLQHYKKTLSWMQTHLLQQHPKRKLREFAQQLDIGEIQLKRLMHETLQRHEKQLGILAGKLDALSPLLTLKRGFAIVTDETHHVLRDAKDVSSGDSVHIQLMKGQLKCKVVKSASA